MEQWSPLWDGIVDSSLWDESDCVVKVFLTMLAKKKKNHVVYGTPYNISRWARKTEAEVLEALKVLASPDTRRMEPQEFEGRRIEKVEGGYLILNGQKYRDMMRQLILRQQKAEYQTSIRAESRGEIPFLPVNPKKSRATESEIVAYAKDLGLPESDGVWYFQRCEEQKWMINERPMRSWKAAMRAWEENGYMPSQKNRPADAPPSRPRWQIGKDIDALKARIEEKRRLFGQSKNGDDRWTPPLSGENKAEIEEQKGKLEKLKLEFDAAPV